MVPPPLPAPLLLVTFHLKLQDPSLPYLRVFVFFSFFLIVVETFFFFSFKG